MSDAVIETLFKPLEDGLIDWPPLGSDFAQTAVFWRGRFGPALSRFDAQGLSFEQGFKPDHDQLLALGLSPRLSPRHKSQDLVSLNLVLPPRQRDEARALLAMAAQSTLEGGIVLAAVSNQEGAKTVEADLFALMGQGQSLSKHKCRAFWVHKTASRLNEGLLNAWLEADQPRPIEQGLMSRPGLFAWDRLDAGSRLLIEALKGLDLKGLAADLGSGYGALSHALARDHKGLLRIDLYEAEQRALEMSKLNMAGFETPWRAYWHDVRQPLMESYDVIVSNPPFHLSRAERHDLGLGFIATAAQSLKPGGSFFMVANRHLPYEAHLKAQFKSLSLLKDDGAFKVYRAQKEKSRS